MICKTMKRGVIGAGLGVLALGLLFGTSAPHYVKTAFQHVRSAADSQVPIEFKIDQARQQIAELEPAISDNIEALVRAEVAVEDLEKEIALTEANLEAEGREMLALNEALKDGQLKLASDGIAYSPEEIKADLERRLDHYRTTKESLKHKRETIKARVEHVQAIRKALNQLDDMIERYEEERAAEADAAEEGPAPVLPDSGAFPAVGAAPAGDELEALRALPIDKLLRAYILTQVEAGRLSLDDLLARAKQL